jgi:hypothetical protein
MTNTTSLRSYTAEMNGRSAVAIFGKSATRYVVSMMVGESRAAEVTGNDLLDLAHVAENARATGTYTSVYITDRIMHGQSVTRGDVRKAREQAAA